MKIWTQLHLFHQLVHIFEWIQCCREKCWEIRWFILRYKTELHLNIFSLALKLVLKPRMTVLAIMNSVIKFIKRTIGIVYSKNIIVVFRFDLKQKKLNWCIILFSIILVGRCRSNRKYENWSWFHIKNDWFSRR